MITLDKEKKKLSIGEKIGLGIIIILGASIAIMFGYIVYEWCTNIGWDGRTWALAIELGIFMFWYIGTR